MSPCEAGPQGIVRDAAGAERLGRRSWERRQGPYTHAVSQSLGAQIPEGIRPLFSGTALEEREGLTFLLLTATPDGWPHLAMLSVGEVVLLDERRLRVALWPNSTATANVTASARSTVALVHAGAGYYLRCTAARQADIMVPAGGRLAVFDLAVEDALEDRAPYAELTGGVSYRLKDPGAVMPRWRATVEAMLQRP